MPQDETENQAMKKPAAAMQALPAAATPVIPRTAAVKATIPVNAKTPVKAAMPVIPKIPVKARCMQRRSGSVTTACCWGAAAR